MPERRWVLLSYRVPREPSTPRIAVWRTLRRLGVARLNDGLVALPADARTREQLEWLAEEIVQADGAATIWIAQAGSIAHERELIAQMQTAVAQEYRTLLAAAVGGGTDRRAVGRLRRELRAIGRRDYFLVPEREQATAAVEALAERMEQAA